MQATSNSEARAMIHVFSHYVPARLIVLAAVEVMILMIAAYAGISLQLGGSGAVISSGVEAVPSLAIGFKTIV